MIKKVSKMPPAPCHLERPLFSAGLCRDCYRAQIQSRKPSPRRGRTLDDKFAEMVDRSPEWNGCHHWMGGFGQWGIPQVEHDGRSRSVRRLVWENLYGPVPEARHVTVTCGSNSCLNPDHLALRVVGGDVVERFWEKVQKSGPVVRPELGECWTWLAGHQKGYPVFHPTERTRVFAHRKMYELMIAPIPTDDGEWCVCHKCDNPGCINPDHFFLGRDADNAADKVAKGRQAKGEKLGGAARAAHERRKARAA
jgi:hypothetical protein